MKNSFKIVAFDADDTLWVNEPYYRETEKKFYELLGDYASKEVLADALYKTEMQNLQLYGYGAKGLTLSMIETALRISNNGLPSDIIDAIVRLGKELINKPLVLLDDVKLVLNKLNDAGIKPILVTKGDLLDQERKLTNSGLINFFHHVEIVSNKTESDYRKLTSKLGIEPDEFLMIGNSRKSDIIPVVNIGGYAIFIPYHTSWQHEEAGKVQSDHCMEVKSIIEIINVLT